MKKKVCVHGHFYQPPRENPWLEIVEAQESAYPFHDWNEKIAKECYIPNCHARILSGNGKIVDIVNNYLSMSFNFGPTLLSWLKQAFPETYALIKEADRQSIKNIGHGSAIAQCYNHMIMPLASERDKTTQVKWGIRDFIYRFGRVPDGMWLPETAVDISTLEALAAEKIKFTILAPHQAMMIRKIKGEDWKSPDTEPNFMNRPYRCLLPSKNSIVIFFYDGGLAHKLAFGSLLDDGYNFAYALLSSFKREEDRLISIAVDGETFGHHHKFGDMALAACFQTLEQHGVEVTNYSKVAAEDKIEYEVKIVEKSSWSCAHGIERWRSDCGCQAGRNPGGNQKWRQPLREALDFLRDHFAEFFEREGKNYFTFPWEARDNYIDVILDRENKLEGFLKDSCKRELSLEEKSKALALLEMERNTLLMYTSCGFFFDDISDIETVQILLYAAKAIELASRYFKYDLEGQFLEILKKAKSNFLKYGNGDAVYKTLVKTRVVPLEKIAAGFAFSYLFEKHDGQRFFSYDVKIVEEKNFERGKHKLFFGKVKFSSRITLDSYDFDYLVFHLHDQNMLVSIYPDNHPYNLNLIVETFLKADSAVLMHSLKDHLSAHVYTFKDFFFDSRQNILTSLLDRTVDEIENSIIHTIENHYSMIRAYKENALILPQILSKNLDFYFTTKISQTLKKKEDVHLIAFLLSEAEKWRVDINLEEILQHAQKYLDFAIGEWQKTPFDINRLEMIETIVKRATSYNLNIDYWRAQNVCFELLKKIKMEGLPAQIDKQRWETVSSMLIDYLKLEI